MDDDLDLLARWRSGDRAAGETLARKYYREIFERLRRKVGGNPELAAELTQQVFEVVVSKRDDIVTDFRRYLHGAARFKLWEHYRRKTSGAMEDDPHLSRMIDPGQGAHSVMAKAEDARLLVKALQSLSVEEQAYLMWGYADKLSQPEIARRVGLTTAQVNGRMFRARDKLRRRLDELSRSADQRGSIDKGFDTWVMSLRRQVSEDDEDDDSGANST